MFFVIKKFENTFKSPTDPINTPICCVFKLITSLSQTGRYTVFKLTKINMVKYRDMIL